ncbi:MAG: hypothetical protein EPN97_11305 [Alphaproteobacteria bacterium]|nr:MAG: hypothetical protein EPN97_11305 [Alphaproteobacteria bacterium]
MRPTNLEDARSAFNEVSAGTLRGRDSFAKLLGAQSNLRLSGMDPASEEAYKAIGTTKETFTSLLRAKYLRAARENYEDSIDANFLGANRQIQDALSDLHLVPAYMALGGLDPAKDESWPAAIGASREEYMTVKRTRLTDEAKRCFDMVEQPNRDHKSKVSALESAQYYLKEAGFSLTDEKAYAAIKTTKTDFDALQKKERELAHREFGF